MCTELIQTRPKFDDIKHTTNLKEWEPNNKENLYRNHILVVQSIAILPPELPYILYEVITYSQIQQDQIFYKHCPDVLRCSLKCNKDQHTA